MVRSRRPVFIAGQGNTLEPCVCSRAVTKYGPTLFKRLDPAHHRDPLTLTY